MQKRPTIRSVAVSHSRFPILIVGCATRSPSSSRGAMQPQNWSAVCISLMILLPIILTLYLSRHSRPRPRTSAIPRPYFSSVPPRLRTSSVKTGYSSPGDSIRARRGRKDGRTAAEAIVSRISIGHSKGKTLIDCLSL